MSRLQRVVAAGVAVASLVCAVAVIEVVLPSPAHASSSEVSMLIDDDQLIYVSTQHMIRTLRTLHELGVDVVKVSMVWQLVAPGAESNQRPDFDATDPAAYPPGAWSRWDALVQTAHQLGMKVYFLVIGPAPLWAVPQGNQTNQGPSLGWAPNPSDYEQFVEAVGRRYSGSYVDPAQPGAGPIPRVDYWGIWNEPNERSWLNPWFRSLPHHRKAMLQPQLYRGVVDAAWSGLMASGHQGDTIMVGETANAGTMAPLPFIRALYCVGRNLRPLTGAAASAYGCPTAGPGSDFVTTNPGLFQAAFAHHPYAFPYQGPPNRPYPDRTFVTLYNVPSFERMLRRIFAAYGQHPSGGVPLYLTEWGYKTDPPNPFVKTPPALQATWLNQGEYMTWKEPYVRSLTQFLLVDSPPKAHTRRGSVLYWSTFQTGLEYSGGKPKSSFRAYQVPIWLPSAHHGRHVTVWGELRPELAGPHPGPTQFGEIEFERRGSRQWKELSRVQTTSAEGFILTHVSIPSAGQVRLDFLDPNGSVLTSRSVPVS